MPKNLILRSNEDVRLAIRRRSNEIAAQLTDEEFFTSAQFERYATSLADFILRKHRLYSMDMVYQKDSGGPIAYTDGKKIFWNTANRLASAPKSLERRFKTNLGILFHEIGHKLFLDFKAENQFFDELQHGSLQGAFQTGDNSELEKAHAELEQVMSNGYGPAVVEIYADLYNRIADGHDEAAMKNCFPGFIADCIITANDVQMENSPTLRELIDSRADSYGIVSALILEYCKWGYYSVGEENEDTEKFLNIVTPLEPILDAILAKDSFQTQLDDLNLLILNLWPFLREKFPDNPQPDNSGQGSSTYSQSGNSGQGGSTGPQSGNSGQGSTPCPASTPSPSEVASAVSQAAQSASNSMNANPAPINCNSKALAPDKVAKGDDSSNNDSGSSSANSSAAPSGNLSGLIGSISTEKAAKDVQKQMDAAEKELIRSVNLPLIHETIPLTVTRHNQEDKDRYMTIAREVDPIVRNLSREMLALLQDLNEEFTQRHRQFGPIIQASEAYRQDKRFFAKKKLPADLPNMALCVLIDQSGSMFGENIDYARQTAIMLERFASQIKIPLMVAGHYSSGKHCKLQIFTDFVSATTDRDRYSVAGMGTHGCNRDGLAIRVCADLLSRRQEEVKLMVVISDGSPADYGYQGEPAMKDITETVKEYRRKGLLIYGAAIDEDREIIEQIYGKGFLSIQNLSAMPKTMIRLIRQQIF